MISERDLGRIAVARTAQGDLVVVGKIISYTDAPTVGIRSVDGMQITWRADMCKVIELSQDEANALFPEHVANGMYGQLARATPGENR